MQAPKFHGCKGSLGQRRCISCIKAVCVIARVPGKQRECCKNSARKKLHSQHVTLACPFVCVTGGSGILFFEQGVDVTSLESLKRPELWEGVTQVRDMRVHEPHTTGKEKQMLQVSR